MKILLKNTNKCLHFRRGVVYYECKAKISSLFEIDGRFAV